MAPTDRWLSGRKHRTRNAAYGQLYRGFESLPVRHLRRVVVSPVSVSGPKSPAVAGPLLATSEDVAVVTQRPNSAYFHRNSAKLSVFSSAREFGERAMKIRPKPVLASLVATSLTLFCALKADGAERDTVKNNAGRNDAGHD